MFFFIQGLPENFAERIVVQNPQSPTEALQIAKTLEQMKLMYKPNEKSALDTLKNEVAKEAKVMAAQNNNYKDKELKEMLSSIAKSIEKLETTFTESRQTSYEREDNEGNGSYY